MAAHSKRTGHPHITAAVDTLAALALPLVEWFDDLTRSERVFQIARAFVLTALAVVVIAVLAACDTGTNSTPPATTGAVPTAAADRPEEDEPGWICSVNDDSCDETSY